MVKSGLLTILCSLPFFLLGYMAQKYSYPSVRSTLLTIGAFIFIVGVTFATVNFINHMQQKSRLKNLKERQQVTEDLTWSNIFLKDWKMTLVNLIFGAIIGIVSITAFFFIEKLFF